MKARSYLFFLFMVCTFINLDGQITGTVFRDYNINGIKDTNEPVMAGVTITAYNASGVCGTTTSTSTGASNYSLTGCGTGPVRVEFTIPTPGSCNLNGAVDFTSGGGTNYGSSVQFANGNSSNINFALNAPEDYFNPSENPKLYVPCYVNGDPSNTNVAAADAFVGVNYDASSPTQYVATVGEIGSTWGVAYSKQAKKLFTGAFLKRHVGMGPLGSGGIYMIDPNTNVVTNWLDLDAIGIATKGSGTYTGPGPLGPNVPFSPVIGTNAERDLGNGLDQPSYDAPAFAQIGKLSLGDVDISDDGRYLFVMNLYDKTVYRIDLVDPANPQAPTIANVGTRVTSWAVPSPGCANGTHRPFALEFARGNLFVGLVCTAESGSKVDLDGYVYQVTNFLAGTYSTLFTIPLDYGKGRPFTWAGAGYDGWFPWTDDASLTLVPDAIGPPTDWNIHPQPILCDIVFDADGSLILSFFDRMGHQSGWFNYNPHNTEIVSTVVGGDILRAYYNPVTCTYELESNGKEGPSSNKAATAGAGNNQGPNGGEFYFKDCIGCSPNGGGNPHEENVQGGIAMALGSGEVAVAVIDPVQFDSGGLTWYSNTNGEDLKDYELYYSGNFGNPGPSGTFSKANGLGDLEVSGAAAPIEIGNRVWADTDGDGIQDAGEAPIAGVTVQLLQGTTVIATATTDANGNYYFSSATGTNTASAIYGIMQLEPNMTYIVRIPNVQGGSKQAALGTNSLTTANADGSTNGDLRDSDGTLVGNNAEVTVQTTDISVAGANNHTFDFGFSAVTCVTPTATASSTNPTCSGDVAQSNGTITLSGFTIGQRYQYSIGATFNSGSAIPASITVIPASGVIVNNLSNTTQQYTVRIYDAADNTCFVDRTISIVAVICGVCSCSEYIYLNEPGGGGKVHKYLVNADGTLTEINPSGPWYNNNTTGDELDEPHGIAFDLNGYLYIAETSSGDVRKLDCEGNIFPESNFVIAGEGGWNFASIGNNVYLNRISQASVGAFNVCDGSYVNGVDFCDDENNDWGFYYDKRTGYFYSAYKGTGANTENKAAILRYTAADFGSGTCIPEWISPGDGTLTPGVKETVGNTFVRGLTTDAQSNVYVVERQSNNQIARILKYNANGEFVAATAYDNTDGDGGWYLAAGVAYSETCNCLQVSTASSNDDCISTFDLDLNYMGPGVPGNAGGFTEAKAIGILKECCPNLLPSFTKNVCATVGAKYFLNVEAFDDCDGIVCGTSWMPQGTLTGMTFDPCDNSVTITGEGCGTFTLNLAASPTKGCPAQTSVFTICAGLPIATVTATQGTCTGSMSNNNATINITAAINANRAGISLGSVYSGPTYNGVGSIAIIGGVASFPNLMHNTQYTVRIFNRRNNCFEDYTLTTPNIICSSCNLMVTCSPTPQSNCTPINGSATTMVTGGQGTITYLWNSGETTSNISNKAAGTYTVTVTDSFLAGCTSTCQAVITTSVTLPTAQCSKTDNTNCISPNGSATVTTNGNQILWSTGGTNATITGLSNGTYTVTVTNTTTGCTNTCASVINNATVNPTCNITTNSQPSCANLIGGDITVIPSPAAIYTYNWSDIGLGSANRTGLTGGTYTVTVTNTTSNCTGVCNVTLDTPMNCCNISAILPQNIECLDNGTPALITDNRIRFSAQVTNTNTSLTGYNVTINGGTTITPNTNLPYGITQFTLGPGTAGGGATFTITVTDSATPGCTQTFQVTDPGTCTPATPECPPIKCGTATIQVNGN